MGLQLAYRESGTGTPLIIMHGLFGSAANWGVIAQGLRERSHVFLLDLRNHGQSPHIATMSYDEMAGDVLTFMDQQHLDQAVLLGHSMGGKVGMTVALSAPERVQALVCVDSAPVAYDHDRFHFAEAMRSLDLSCIRSRDDADAQLADLVPDQQGRTFLLTNLKRQEDGTFGWRLNLDAIVHEMRDLVGFPEMVPWTSYDGAALFIAGEHSQYVTPANRPQTLALFPEAAFATVADADHNPHTENPVAVIDLLNDFLTTVLAREECR
jgi:esterase